MNTKTCPKCGKEIEYREKYCPECKFPQFDQKICPKCGNIVPIKYAECHKCNFSFCNAPDDKIITVIRNISGDEAGKREDMPKSKITNIKFGKLLGEEGVEYYSGRLLDKPVLLPEGTDGSYGTDGKYALFGNCPQTVKAYDVQSLDKPVLLPEGTDGSYGTKGKYVLFGLWPQTVKADDVRIDETKVWKINDWDAYKGSDNCYYVKAEAESYEDYEFDNGEAIEEGEYYYFKLEPIKWRVVTDDYQGGKLLVAEKILAAKRFDNDSNNYKNSEIRSWLNNDFINGAFTKEAMESINTVAVDNSAESTGESWNEYACENTSDKIFLLSYEEVTRSSYGFDSYKYECDAARIRKTTDYSRSTGAYSSTDEEYKNNGWLWLRSPIYDSGSVARVVLIDGSANSDFSVLDTLVSVVPALSMTF